VAAVVDFAEQAGSGRFLEGTGSLVLDRAHRIAYACASSRTDKALAETWAVQFRYRLCRFDARDPAGMPVYHTNVIMSLGPELAIVCLDALDDPARRKALREQLEATGKEIVAIDWQQVRAFAGNQLFLRASDGPVVVLSATADRALREDQKAVIDRHARRIAVDIATIERHGGGSVRCMLAEIFLPRLQAG
ncbi:MAG TPA: arginine deiminase-related protein, partial [Gammaproteobacteria bacterium]